MTDRPKTDESGDPLADRRERRLKRTVIGVAGLNFAYLSIEFAVALAIGSVSLFADSVDFLEDTAVNLLIFLALGLPLAKRALAGKVMAVIISVPAVAALARAVDKFDEPTPPDALSLVITAGGAIVVNAICAYLPARFRDQAGSMSKAAYLAARNDVKEVWQAATEERLAAHALAGDSGDD